MSWNAWVALADSSGGNNPTLKGKAGTFTTFDPPGSTFTAASAINPAGAITGNYTDANNMGHGFLRARDGTFTTFDALPGSFFIQPSTINPAGVITGTHTDANNVGHGFLWIP